MKAGVKWKDPIKVIDDTLNGVFKYSVFYNIYSMITKVIYMLIYPYIYTYRRTDEASVQYEEYFHKTKWNFNKINIFPSISKLVLQHILKMPIQSIYVSISNCLYVRMY